MLGDADGGGIDERGRGPRGCAARDGARAMDPPAQTARVNPTKRGRAARQRPLPRTVRHGGIRGDGQRRTASGRLLAATPPTSRASHRRACSNGAKRSPADRTVCRLADEITRKAAASASYRVRAAKIAQTSSSSPRPVAPSSRPRSTRHARSGGSRRKGTPRLPRSSSRRPSARGRRTEPADSAGRGPAERFNLASGSSCTSWCLPMASGRSASSARRSR